MNFYQRLNKLRRTGFLCQCIDESGCHKIWTLNSGRPEGVEIFTEQELRRMKLEMYPSWVPQSKNHRADGYWHLSCGDHRLTIALEVELSAKAKDRYDTIVKFYDHYEVVDLVLWLVPKPSLALHIQGSASGPNFYRTQLHNFIELEDFQNHGWQASIFLGPNRGLTVHHLLNQSLLQTLLKSPLKPSPKGTSALRRQHLLDTSLSPQNRDEKSNFKIRHFSD